MSRSRALVLSLGLFLSLAGCGGDVIQERPDWEQFFKSFGAEGTMVILDERVQPAQRFVFNPERAKKRYSPASTFKIPHTLFALDAGLVEDEFQVFKWDGIARSYAPHNQDQTLRSAMQYSAVWVYSNFAEALGEQKARAYLKTINYGNADPSCESGDYWIDGKLAISAYEQVAFLKQLYENELPFQVIHQELVKDIMINEEGNIYTLRAKTGWEGRWGWWVGWVERPSGPVFFALNIDTPNRMNDLYKRQAISRSILVSLKALPEPSE